MSFAPESSARSRFGSRGREGSSRRGLWRSAGDHEESTADEHRAHPVGSSSTSDLGRAALIGAGLAMGIVLGAGIALLVAPDSGARTRMRLTRRVRRARNRARDQWDDWSDAYRYARS